MNAWPFHRRRNLWWLKIDWIWLRFFIGIDGHIKWEKLFIQWHSVPVETYSNLSWWLCVWRESKRDMLCPTYGSWKNPPLELWWTWKSNKTLVDTKYPMPKSIGLALLRMVRIFVFRENFGQRIITNDQSFNWKAVWCWWNFVLHLIDHEFPAFTLLRLFSLLHPCLPWQYKTG